MKKFIKSLIVFVIIAGGLYLAWQPICKIFSAMYNFIQSNAFFTTNFFNFILVVAFFVWLLFYFIDVVGILDKKSKETAKTISDSENKKTEAQKQLDDTKKSLQNIDSEVKKIISEANNIAKNIKSNSNLKLEEELSNIKSRENILKDAQLKKAKNNISVIIANAAVCVSKEYIKNSLDEKMQQELIYDFIDSLDEGIRL